MVQLGKPSWKEEQTWTRATMMPKSSLVHMGTCAWLHKEPLKSFQQCLIPMVVILHRPSHVHEAFWNFKPLPPIANHMLIFICGLADALNHQKILAFKTQDVIPPSFLMPGLAWPILVSYHIYFSLLALICFQANEMWLGLKGVRIIKFLMHSMYHSNKDLHEYELLIF